MRARFVVIAVFVLTNRTWAAEPLQPSTAQEIWETVFARDNAGRDHQIGYSRVLLENTQVDGLKVTRATRELRITIKRDGQLAQLKADTGTVETPEGRVIGVFMRHWIGEKQALVLTGKLEEATFGRRNLIPRGMVAEQMRITVVSNVKDERHIPWDTRVIGLARELSLLKERMIKPGEKFIYRFYEPTISNIVSITVEAKDEEEVLLPRGGKKKMLRVESTPQKIEGVQLPSSTLWLDPTTREVALTQIDMPDFGLLTLQRSTREVATGPLGVIPDLMRQQTLRLGQRINGDVHGLVGIVYRITYKSDLEPNRLIREDDRQTIKNGKGNVFELHIEARRAPRKIDKEMPVADEFLSSNHFINWKNDDVQGLAQKAVGKRTDPWEKAQAIERWVRANMKAVNYSEAMATSDHVAKTLAGDCTEYSMLAAAMCRAQGIPSRTAIGLIYVDSPSFGGPALAFHMWTEVYVKGQWLGIDATLGRGAIGPGHLKITDHSWHDVTSVKPLLPVTGFIMAKPTVEILSATTPKPPE
jgi:transglutaminase-like putative cysteine protease